MFDLAAVNWTAVLAVTLLGFVLGGLWYGPLFGRAWTAAVAAAGRSEAELARGGRVRPLVLAFLTSAASALVLVLLSRGLGLQTLGQGALLGLLTGAGLVAAGQLADMAFRGDPLRLWCLQAGFRTAHSVVMGAVLTVWR